MAVKIDNSTSSQQGMLEGQGMGFHTGGYER